MENKEFRKDLIERLDYIKGNISGIGYISSLENSLVEEMVRTRKELEGIRIELKRKSDPLFGVGKLTTVLFLVFVYLKTNSVIDWSWWWVVSPLVIGLILAILVLLSLPSKDRKEIFYRDT